jgi:trimeric autotransporter adhesin
MKTTHRNAFLAALALTATSAHAVNIAGDTVTTNLTVNGNTTGSGWGLFKQGIDFGANGETILSWWPGVAPAGTATFDITWADGSFTWRDTVVALTSNNKMSLDANNVLTLYKANGGAVGLTLNPNSGITLADGTQINSAVSLRSTALYDALGNIVASVAADGKIKLSNGLTFGSDPNVKLTASNVAALQSTLKNLGYQENPVIGTAIKKIALTNATVTSAAASGGFLYIVGNFSGSASVGGANLYSAGNGDGFVTKLDANGVALWAKPIGGIASDTATSVSVDSSGNVLVGGNFNGTTTNLGALNIPSAGGQDGYVAKFNSNGVVQWAKPIGGISSDFATSVSADSSGNVLVGGNFNGTTTNLAAANITSAGQQDGYVAKFDTSGVVQWAKPIGGISSDNATSLAVDSSGNVAVAGSFQGATTNLVSGNLTSAGGQDGYVAKFNPSGVAQWIKAIGGTSSDNANFVSIDSNSNILV